MKMNRSQWDALQRRRIIPKSKPRRQPKEPAKPKRFYALTVKGMLSADACTKSEARARIKEQLGIPAKERLPVKVYLHA